MNNLKDFKDGISFTTSDIKKLPTTDANKTIVILSLQQKPIDLNKIKAIREVVRQIKINKKKFPQRKSDIDAYFRKILNAFFNFEIGTHDFLEQCKHYPSDEIEINITFESHSQQQTANVNNENVN